MIETLQVLRRAGFFKEWVELDENGIIDEIYEKRKAYYSKIFEREYDPSREIDDLKLAEQDTAKVLHFDTEADVGEGNAIYIWLLQALENYLGEKG